jgi:hypothetical protein
MPKPNYIFKRLVTSSEADKAHITITEIHHNRFKAFFGPIYQENKTKGKPEDSLKDFFIAKKKTSVKLKLIFRSSTPQRPHNELRLYFNKGKGLFKPAANHILIANFYDDRVELDAQPSGVNDAEKLNDKIDKGKFPVDDISYRAYTKPAVQTTRNKRKEWKRDSKLVKKCLKNSDYACEAGLTEPSFIAKSTGKPYLEVHHLVPLHFQNDLKSFNLNDPANLFALSPHAHRKIHHGCSADVRILVETLLTRRPALLAKAKLPQDTVLKMYNCA